MGNFISISIPLDVIFFRCLDCTCRKAKYLRKLEDNLDELKISLEDLVHAANDVRTRIRIAEQQRMKRLHKVELWLARVEAVEIEVGELQNVRSQEIEKLCLAGYCSKNCKSSYEFGKKVAKKLQDVAALKDEGNFKDVAERVPEDSVDEMPIEKTVGLQSTFNLFWRCVEEEHVGVIGLYGMGGVGKTTLLSQINNNFCHKPNDFDIVIWVVVSKDLRLEKIQDKIGQKIGLSSDLWTSKSLQEKALDIFKILSKKKFALLMDDMWERVDLTKVGIPLPNSKNASKVIFTTRDFEVCGLMEAQKYLKVECLAHEEAWKLFQEKVGRGTLSSHHDIPDLAETLAKECGGLPLSLVTVGRAMASKKTPQEWEYAIQSLRRPASKFPGIGKNVYSLLKFSFDNLPNDTIRSCLLYCVLYPEDYSIRVRDLIDCWIGEGFLDEYAPNGVQNHGYHNIGVLIHACLLEEDDDGYVRMHDVIRDMCLWIACEIDKDRENFLVLADALTEIPEARKWEGMRRISLMENELENLSLIPTCPHLQTLFLNCNFLETISTGFFQYMPSLKVLNLSDNPYLSELPSGISKLASLGHLDLSLTAIKELPKELRSLVNLKCLNLEGTIDLRTIPLQLIASFSVLHVLRMFICGSFNQEAEDNVLFKDGEFLIEELLCLKHLNILSITVNSFGTLQKFVSSQKLQRCTQALCLRYFGNSKSIDVFSLADMNHLKTLYVTKCEELEELTFYYTGQVQKDIATHGFHSLQSVHIDYCSKLRDTTWLILAPNLKHIWILDCSDMEEVISVAKLDGVRAIIGKLNPFEKLEFLILKNLANLKSIYDNSLLFPHLKEIAVEDCPDLKKLPLNFNSGKEGKIVIKGDENWWNQLQWEDDATQNVFLPCFISFPFDFTDKEWRFWSGI